MTHLKEKRYADMYRGRNEPIQLIGIEFTSKTRDVVKFEFECG